jgi:hypothetical protein
VSFGTLELHGQEVISVLSADGGRFVAKMEKASGEVSSDHVKRPWRMALTVASGRLAGHLWTVWMT